ncbi:MAG: leucine-rich repeat domain-containing protein [Ruminococcus sp.]|nr:leucine-rich repeat domain-containing protein [Ruminococcus sp.]
MLSKLLAAASAVAVAVSTAFAFFPADKANALDEYSDYTISEDGKYYYETIVNTGDVVYHGQTAKPGATLTIPSKIDGKTVSDVGELVDKSYSAVTKVSIPNTVNYIASGAFIKLNNLSDVTLPDSVKTICGAAFKGLTKLKAITIPKNVEKIIDGNPFFGCTDLKITVDQQNKKLKVKNGMVLDKTGKIVHFPLEQKTSFTVPDGTEIIDYLAFCDQKNLTSVKLPSSLIQVRYGAFHNCPNLKGVAVPDNVGNFESVDPGSEEDGIEYSAFGFETVRVYDEDEGYYEASTLVDGFALYGTPGKEAQWYCNTYDVPFISTSISKDKVTIPYSSYTYRGRGIKPSVTVKDPTGTKLKKGVDYTVAYKNNTNVGTATITVTGTGNCNGTLTKTFSVKALDLNSSYAKVTIPYSAYTYTGSAIKPAVTVKFKDGDVIPSDQYTVSYSNNTKVGTATITVKGKGTNVTGTCKKTFVVKPAKNEITSITSPSKGAFKISWKKGTAGTVGYQVLYSQDQTALKSASGEVKNTNAKKYVHSYTSTNLSDLSETFSKIPASGETWYVKVRSFYTKDGKTTSTRYGNYSDIKSIKVK